MTPVLRRSPGWITALVLAAWHWCWPAPPRSRPDTSVLPPGAIAPTDQQRATARKVGRILEEQHYSRAAIDDKMSEVVYERYLEFLDGQHSYFLPSDINEFDAVALPVRRHDPHRDD